MTVINKSNERLERKQVSDALTAVEGRVTTLEGSGYDPSICAHLSMTSVQNMGGANGTVKYIDWDGSQITIDSNFTHSTGTNPSRITVVAAGRYALYFVVSGDNTGANRITLMTHYRINGSTVVTRGRQRNYGRGSSYGDISVGITTEIDLTAGQYIEVGTTVDDADAVYTVNTIPAECELILRKLY